MIDHSYNILVKNLKSLVEADKATMTSFSNMFQNSLAILI